MHRLNLISKVFSILRTNALAAFIILLTSPCSIKALETSASTIDKQIELASSLLRDEKFADAEETFQKAINLSAASPVTPAFSQGLTRLGLAQTELGKYLKAEDTLKQATEVAKQPAMGNFERAEAYQALGNLYLLLFRLDEAKTWCQAARSEASSAPDAMRNKSEFYNALSEECLALTGIDDGAVPISQDTPLALNRALEILSNNKLSDPLTLARAYFSIARLYLRNGDTEAAKGEIDAGLKFCPINSTSVCEAEGRTYLAGAYILEKQFPFADKELDQAQSAIQLLLGEEHPLLAEVFYMRAFVLLNKNKAFDASEIADRARSIVIKTQANESPLLANIFLIHGIAMAQMGAFTAADSDMRRCTEIRTHFFGSQSPQVIAALQNWGKIMLMAGKIEAAEQLEVKIKKIQANQR